MTTPDVWDRERSLARTTVAWGVGSLAVGAAAAASRDPWRRSFGWQTAGWGAVDLAIAVVAGRLQTRRMAARPDPRAASALEAERVTLRRVLLANTVADVGYVALGLGLARDDRPRVAGSGAAIVVQGVFLAAHDGSHAARARPA